MDPQKPRLYTLYGQLVGPNDHDAEEIAIAVDLPEVEIKAEYRAKVANMRSSGFHVRNFADDVTNLPSCLVINPVSGHDECRYWILETA